MDKDLWWGVDRGVARFREDDYEQEASDPEKRRLVIYSGSPR